MELTKRKYSLFLFLLLFFHSEKGLGQGEGFFSENPFADYPVISLKENFLGNPVYFAEGRKIKASEVKAYMEIMPGDANKFGKVHSRLVAGNILYFSGHAAVTGGLVYLLANRDNGAISSQVFSNFVLLGNGGIILSEIGDGMKRQGVREINGLIENHNYLIRKEEFQGPYLKMDVRPIFFGGGQKIDLYDGPNLLNKQRLNQIKLDYPELQAFLQKAEKAQNWSLALDILTLASQLVFVTYVASSQLQSSLSSNLLFPLFVVDVGAGISSRIVRRNARNHTRMALHRFNFGGN